MFTGKIEPHYASFFVVGAGAGRLDDEVRPLVDGVIPHEDAEFDLGTVGNGMYSWTFGVFSVFFDGREIVICKQYLDI